MQEVFGMADTGLLEGTNDDLVFTDGDLLAALEAALRGVDEGPADAHTVAELVALTGATDYNVRRALMRLKVAGRLEVCHVKRRRLDDRAVMTAAYRWKAAANPVEFDGIKP